MNDADHPYVNHSLHGLGWVSPTSGLLVDVHRARQGAKILDRVHRRHQTRLRESWLYPPDSPLGAQGLSNGAYCAAAVPDAKKAAVDNLIRELRGQILWRPGTIRIKLSGSLNYLRPKNPRGQIRHLSKAAKGRLSAHTRDLEALGYRPGYMVSLTYPRNWRAALSGDEPVLAELRAAWGRLEELRATAKRCREIMRYNRAGLGQFRRVEELLEEQRSVVRALVNRARKLAPDGRRVKRHMSAWLKRFDRRFGTNHQSFFPTFCAAAQAQKTIQGSTIRRLKRPTTEQRARGLIWVVKTPNHRCTWWLEFQRRGAPHIHMIFFDTRGINFEQDVRPWAGQAWAAVVAGRKSLEEYQNTDLGIIYDQLRELWGPATAREFFAIELSRGGLDIGIWDHVSAGTRVEAMQKPHWGYMAAEASGGRHKIHQKRVPRAYQNVGRWWGYRKYKRPREEFRTVSLDGQNLLHNIINPLASAVATLPQGCFRFAKKVGRFLEAVRARADYGYITVWGRAAVSAALAALGFTPLGSPGGISPGGM